MQFEVRQGNGLEAFNVELDKKTCSCRQWQLIGIPCPHSITAMYFVNMNPDDFTSDSFRLETYKRIYDFNIKPVKGIDHRKKNKTSKMPSTCGKEECQEGLLLQEKKIKSELRKHVAKAPKFMTCKKCHKRSHNSSTRTNEKAHSLEKIPMKKGRLVEDPLNAKVPANRKRKVGPSNKPSPSKKGGTSCQFSSRRSFASN